MAEHSSDSTQKDRNYCTLDASAAAVRQQRTWATSGKN